jgi:hypothetical protein
MKSTKPAGPRRPAESGIDSAHRGGSGDRVALLEQLRELSGPAADAVGGYEEVWLDVGGNPLLLRFAGPALMELLLPALAHLRIEPAKQPALTVDLWDSASTGAPAPTPAWGPEDYREYGVIRGFFGDGFFTVFDWGTAALNVVDLGSRQGFFWLPDADRIGLPERGAPLRTLLNLWMSGLGMQLVHGAAVGRADGCVLMVGRSGVGKSSTALSCLDSDLMLIGEDYCVLSPGEPPRLASLYSSGKVEPAVIARVPGLEQLAVAGPDASYHKSLLDLHARMPEKLLRGAPLRAILVPRVTGETETTLRPCSAGAALRAVAPNTILQLPGNGRPAMELLSSVVRAVPCHHLDLGTDPSLIPPALERVLDEGSDAQ